jgi:hypothetical protein
MLGGAGLWPAKSVFEPTFVVALMQNGEDAATNGGMAGRETRSTGTDSAWKTEGH